MNNLFKRRLLIIKGYSYFFLRKIYLRRNHTFIQLVQVLENPDTRTAMNMRNIQPDDSSCCLFKIQKLGHNILIVQKIEFGFDVFGRGSGVLFKLIITI